MVDDDDKKSDEYEYPSEEYFKGGEYIPPEESIESLESGEPPGRPTVSKRILLILGIIIAIGIVYLVLSFANSRKNAELSQATPPITMNGAPSTVAAVQESPTQAITPVVPDDALARMAQQNQINQQAMADLQGQMQQLQTQINGLTSSISTLNNQMQVIANEVRAIATDRSLRGRGLSLTTSGTIYHIKAMVPGRAWLQSRIGNTTSVTIGDRLPGYGIIQMINTDQGIVTTSSGALIQYGPKDS